MSDRMPDPQELVRFLARHQGLMQAYAYAIVNDLHLMEDVVQETSLFVAERWAQLPPEHAAAERWLKGVLRRKSLEALREKPGDHLHLDEAALARLDEAFDEPEPDRAQRVAALRHCLDHLAGRARSVLEARHVEGEGCERIAARIGRPVATVYTILKRARQALADCVERRLARAGARP